MWEPWQCLPDVRYFIWKLEPTVTSWGCHKILFLPMSAIPHTSTKKTRRTSELDADFFFCCYPNPRVPFLGCCSRSACHHWFPGLQIPMWVSGLVTWIGHPENNYAKCEQWRSKIAIRFPPPKKSVIVSYVCVCMRSEYICAYVCRWVFMNISVGILCSPVTSFPYTLPCSLSFGVPCAGACGLLPISQSDSEPFPPYIPAPFSFLQMLICFCISQKSYSNIVGSIDQKRALVRLWFLTLLLLHHLHTLPPVSIHSYYKLSSVGFLNFHAIGTRKGNRSAKGCKLMAFGGEILAFICH